MVVVFLKDVEANYLLASNAGGRMPCHLQLECGLEGVQDLSSLETSSSSDKSGNGHRRRAAMVEAEKETKKLKTKLETCMDNMDSCFQMVSNMCKNRQEGIATVQPAPMNVTVDDLTESTKVFDAITKLNLAINDTGSMTSMSPCTREKYMSSLQARRKRLIEALFDLEEKK
jgi:hypothetical protein